MVNIVPSILLSLGALVIGAIAGALFTAPFEASGPRSLFRHFLFTSLVAVLVPVIPVLVWGTEVFTNHFDGTMNIFMFGSGAAGVFFTALIIWKTAAGRIAEHLSMVEQVKPFILTNFKVLDGDEDGVLSGGDLAHAETEKLLTDENDRKVLTFVRSNLGFIGHGVGSYRTYNAATKTTSSHTVSVISPRDVEGFAEREQAKYAAWR